MPPESVRRASSKLLAALDDKIELNRRTNETLEETARALFRDWFVDFGPTRAKMAMRGEDPEKDNIPREPYLAPDLWALFPDRLDDATGLPEGWEQDTLSAYSGLQNGYAFKSKDWCEQGTPVVKIGSVKPSFVDLNQVSFVDPKMMRERPNFVLSAGDILVGLTGYVGETGRVPPTQSLPMLNQRVGRFLPRAGLEAFVFTCVRQSDFKKYAEEKSHGSAQANVSTKDLLSFPVPSPCEKLVKIFCEFAFPLFETALSNSGQVAALARTRDLLLPKLMSGEIRLRDAEKIAEEAAA